MITHDIENIIFGDNDHNWMVAGATNDYIDAGAGDDYVLAGNGNDIIFAGDGNDAIFAGDGNDIIWTSWAGEGEVDYIQGGRGADTFNFVGSMHLQGEHFITVDDFNSEEGDKLMFNTSSSDHPLESASDFNSLVEFQGNTYIQFENTTVELIGVEISSLNSNNLTFDLSNLNLV